MDNVWNQTELFKISDFQKQISEVKFDLSKTKYKFVEKIGTGAYGIVCQAKSVHENNDYAIKKIKNPFNHRVTLIRTLREIRILNFFKHINIINIVDMFLKESNNNKDIYVVFDLMESDLHKIIISKQLLSDDHIRYFMYQIFCGVNYIHSASVIHRDLKPANILVNSNCHLKIADFGMARCLATSTKCDTKFSESASNFNMTQYVMTRWYRAPELLMGQLSYNTKIDLWSCGCILAELYLKNPLFRGDNMINQLKEIIQKMGTPTSQFRLKVLPIVNSLINAEGDLKPTSLNQLVPTAPKKVVDLLSHLLVYDPDQRWSAMQCLKHIFFIKYKNPLKEEICQSTLDLSFEVELNTVDLLKDALLKEISLMQSKQSNNYSSSNQLKFYNDKIEDSEKLISSTLEVQSYNIDSPTSERTLSADSGKELGYPVKYFECEGPFTNLSQSSDGFEVNRFKTVSQFTKNKIINAIRKPKGKSNKKIVTAAQRQKERKDKKLKQKHKRDVKFKTLKTESNQDQLSELDKSFLKKWEHITNFKMKNNQDMHDMENCKEYSANNYDDITLPTDLITKPQSNEVDDMSAGLSALLLLDDIIECDKNNISKFQSNSQINDINSNNNIHSSTENFDLIFDVDIDCIDLDLNILESYSCDLIKDELKNSFN